MFYISALLAIAGAVGYMFFIKRVPHEINPIISAVGAYIAVLGIAGLLLAIFPPQGGFLSHVRQLNWVQIAVAVCIMMMEIGYLLMYRYGWNLSTGNIVSGVVINSILLLIGLFLLGEKLSWVNLLGVALSILGVVLIGLR